MRKILFIAAIALAAAAHAGAPVTVEGSEFIDNWSVTVKGGSVTSGKTVGKHGWWGSTRGMVGAELRKQVTPVLGLGVEGQWSVNTSSWTSLRSANVFDHQYVGIFGAVNFMNAFAGYAGHPRCFELEAVAGTGWLHAYYPHDTAKDANSWATKVGLNFNFNLGAAKAWTLSLKPSYIWNMNGSVKPNILGCESRYDRNYSALELQVGVTYHFGNSNGTSSFVLAPTCNPSEIEALNAQINALRAELDACAVDNAAMAGTIADLQSQLMAAQGRQPIVVEKVVSDGCNTRYVFFNCGSSAILPDQQPVIAMAANRLTDNAKATVTIQGYASKDGSAAFNDRLAAARAEAVKKVLIATYGIAPERITTEGKGIGSIFSENAWNRVAILTIAE